MGKPIFKNLTRMAFSPFRERGVVETLRSMGSFLYARRQDRADDSFVASAPTPITT